MRISIITPSKNQGQYIQHCMASIYSQTHPTIEHIVIDGLSTDDTVELVGRYPSVLIRSADSGPAQAINKGLDMATGDIVCWLNADDAFAGPEVLAAVATLFRQHPEVDVITGNGYYIDDRGRLLAPIIPDRAEYISQVWMKRHDGFLQPATFWRSNALRVNELLRYTFDWRLWLDFYAAGLNIYYVPRCFALYRVHLQSLTQQDPSLRRREIYNLLTAYSDSSVQRWWSWLVWKLFLLDEQLQMTILRTGVKVLNRLLQRASAGRFGTG